MLIVKHSFHCNNNSKQKLQNSEVSHSFEQPVTMQNVTGPELKVGFNIRICWQFVNLQQDIWNQNARFSPYIPQLCESISYFHVHLRFYLWACIFTSYVLWSWRLHKSYSMYIGQLISKGLFGILNSYKKRKKKFDLTTMILQVDLFSFIFGRHFEMNWPLACANTVS